MHDSSGKAREHSARYRTVRWSAAAMGVGLVLLAWLPEWLGLGAAGLGPLQFALLVLGGTCWGLAVFLGRMPGGPLLLLVSSGLGAAFVISLLGISGTEPGWFLWRLQQRLGGAAKLGIYEPDDVLGWVHRAGTRAVDEHYDYRAEYTIGPNGFRVGGVKAVGDGATDRMEPAGLCLGGSFTFGQGVEDAEAYPAVWDQLAGPSNRIVNAGVNGWGTVQAMLFLRRYLQTESCPRVVTYGWIPAHGVRNADRRSWLELLAASGRRKPVVRVEQDRVLFDRLVGPQDGVPESADLEAAERRVTEACMLAMHRMCGEAGGRFMLLLLGNDASGETPGAADVEWLRRFAETEGIFCLDLRSIEPERFPHDGHPTPAWHAAVGEALWQNTELQLALQDTLNADTTE